MVATQQHKLYPAIMEEMVLDLEEFCKTNHINHRFVGGISYGGLLNDKTTYLINVPNREIQLKKHNPVTLLREDGTVRDIDLIFLTQNQTDIKKLKEYVRDLKWKTRNKISFTPSISIEGVRQINEKEKAGQFFQYVTEIGIKNGRYFLMFDEVKEGITVESLEPWSVVLENGVRYTTRNPLADYYAYQFRSPSGVKQKDIDKVKLLKKLSSQVVKEGLKNSVAYNSKQYYQSWQQYIRKLQRSTLPAVLSKRAILAWYWQTLGTSFAHGKGLLGKAIFGLYNTVTRNQL